jgi:hypothetical protein
MSTDVAEAPTTTAVAKRDPITPTAGGAISAFASEGNFVSAQRMAQALMQSSLVPNEYRGNLPNTLIAMELASRIGCSVLMVMQNMTPVQGKPYWSSTFLIACVNASGRFTSLRFRFQGDEGTDDWGCRAVAKDVETGEECLGALVSIGIAKKEGWYNRNGSKWKTIPEQMLMYRAAAWWSRVFCPEMAMGIRPVDEGEDMGYSRYSTPAPSDAAAEMEAALREAAGGEIPIVDGVPVEEDDAPKKATEAALSVLAELREKARGADAIDLELEAFVSDALESGTDDAVKEAKKRLNSAIASAKKEG